MKTLIKGIEAKYRSTCINAYTFVVKNANLFGFVLGAFLIVAGSIDLSAAQTGATKTFSQTNYNDTLVRASVANLFCLIEGAFGALIMVVAGLGAIVAAAMGAYRAAVGMLVVAVGAFILRSLVSLFFGNNYDPISQTQTGGACR